MAPCINHVLVALKINTIGQANEAAAAAINGAVPKRMQSGVSFASYLHRVQWI